ncbi:glycosyltransferase [Rubrimonas sp.]|uniref:glycosyltransferase n=1 Tax=Rubrimonas sp. TaxID=2036015 RepID=UPI002FDDA8D8
MTKEQRLDTLRIACLFMTYPMPLQPWAISNVQAHEANGHQVDVYALRGRQPDHAETVRRYRLDLPAVAHPSRETAAAIASPRNWGMALYVLGLILRHLWRRPEELAKSVILLPRVVEICARLRDDPPDVVHAFWGHYPSMVLLAGARFFPSVHRSLFLGNYDLLPRPFGLSGRAAAIADSIWTATEANLPLIASLGVSTDRVTIAHWGVPLDLADQAPVDRVPGRICTASNFQKEKNIDLVIRAFALVAAERPEASLVIAGDGAERQALEALTATLGLVDRVTFTGLLTRERLFSELRQAEVFLFLSTKATERLPNAVMEAMLAEAFCIVSRTDDIEKLIIDNSTGQVVDQLAPEAVAPVVISALDDPQRAACGRRASDLVRNKFSVNAMMGVYTSGWQRGQKQRRAGDR